MVPIHKTARSIAYCHLCSATRAASNGRYEEPLALRPNFAWIQTLCSLTNTLKAELNALLLATEGALPELSTAIAQAKQWRTRHAQLKDRQTNALLTGGVSVQVARNFYTEQVTLDQGWLASLTALNRMAVEAMVDARRLPPPDVHGVIVALYATMETPPPSLVQQVLDEQLRSGIAGTQTSRKYSSTPVGVPYSKEELTSATCDGCHALLEPVEVGDLSYCELCDCCRRGMAQSLIQTQCEETGIQICHVCFQNGDPGLLERIIRQPRNRPRDADVNLVFAHIGSLQALNKRHVIGSAVNPHRGRAEAQLVELKEKRHQIRSSHRVVAGRGPVPIPVSRELYLSRLEVERHVVAVIYPLAKMLLEEAALKNLSLSPKVKAVAVRVLAGVELPDALVAFIQTPKTTAEVAVIKIKTKTKTIPNPQPLSLLPLPAVEPVVACDGCAVMLEAFQTVTGPAGLCDCCLRMLPARAIVKTIKCDPSTVFSICKPCDDHQTATREGAADIVGKTPPKPRIDRLNMDKVGGVVQRLRSFVDTAFPKAGSAVGMGTGMGGAMNTDHQRLQLAEQALQSWITRAKAFRIRAKAALKAKKKQVSVSLSRQLYAEKITINEGVWTALNEYFHIVLEMASKTKVEMRTKLLALVADILHLGPQNPARLEEVAVGDVEVVLGTVFAEKKRSRSRSPLSEKKRSVLRQEETDNAHERSGSDSHERKRMSEFRQNEWRNEQGDSDHAHHDTGPPGNGNSQLSENDERPRKKNAT